MGQEADESAGINQLSGNPVNIGTPSKSGKNILILLCILLFVFIAGTNLYLYQKQKTANNPVTTKTNVVTPLPAGWETYTSPGKDYEFNYPGSWKILSGIPDEFMYVDMFNNLKGQEGIDWFNSKTGHSKWLSGKMFITKTCRGPILQNKADANQLIVFDIYNASDKTASCYSAGWFFEYNKWKVSDKDPYPISEANSGDFPDIKWKGDYRIIKRILNTKGLAISSVLVNRETYVIKG